VFTGDEDGLAEAVVEKFPDIVVDEDFGAPEIMVRLSVVLDNVDLESVVVALGAMVTDEDNDDVPRVILELNDWYVPVGVRRSVVERALLPDTSVMPAVLSVGSCATAPDKSQMLASPTARRNAM
jgi:hypothetical protein